MSRPIGEAGADKLLLCEADDFADAPADASHGRALDAAAARVPPMLVLFPAGGAGAALGPPLAARLGGPFAPWCDFLTTDADVPVPEDAGRVQLIHLRPDGRSRRRLDPIEIERPIVATLGAGRRPRATGSLRDLEVEVVASPKPSARSTATVKPAAPDVAVPVEQERIADPHAVFELASVLVLIGEFSRGDPGGITSLARDSLDASLATSLNALMAGSPAGTVVARASDVPAEVLSACCPDILLKIGPSAAQTARSPRTRVVLAAISPMTDPAPDDVDVLWQVPSSADLNADAIRALLAAMRDQS